MIEVSDWRMDMIWSWIWTDLSDEFAVGIDFQS